MAGDVDELTQERYGPVLPVWELVAKPRPRPQRRYPVPKWRLREIENDRLIEAIRRYSP